MEDFDEDLDALPELKSLRSRLERKKSFESEYDDASDTPEGREAQWDHWMCALCGTFMRERHSECVRCHSPR